MEDSSMPGARKAWSQHLLAWMWPLVALASVGFSLVLLEGKLRAEASADPIVRAMLDDGPFASDVQVITQVICEKLALIAWQDYLLAALSALGAYAALGWYDRIALRHLGKQSKVSVPFSFLCSFVSYALGHNIGASVVSGGAVRLRAYASQGLSKLEVAALISFCSFTFGLGALLLLGGALAWDPQLAAPLLARLPQQWLTDAGVRGIGFVMLVLCAAYVGAAFLGLKPLQIGRFQLRYPKPGVVLQQIVAGPLELVAAAGIIYFVLPSEGNPGYTTVLGAFLIAFCVSLLSQVPGGMGVMEAVFIALMPDVPAVAVMAALLVWRLFYLLVPLLASGPIILAFELKQWLRPGGATG
ncbi:lysylphosphatidylglycerol synthase transmembrane domain-containing protein [Roseateles sp. NT4]|uniref:lysylphosphatidylglycerol synthase transmembrane domain-containing protein n=1 Tax=Roseateles sp. NT4 TaxID=3453715 RepID=UPI003EE8566E